VNMRRGEDREGRPASDQGAVAILKPEMLNAGING
jgi:hypothetical protein